VVGFAGILQFLRGISGISREFVGFSVFLVYFSSVLAVFGCFFGNLLVFGVGIIQYFADLGVRWILFCARVWWYFRHFLGFGVFFGNFSGF